MGISNFLKLGSSSVGNSIFFIFEVDPNSEGDSTFSPIFKLGTNSVG